MGRERSENFCGVRCGMRRGAQCLTDQIQKLKRVSFSGSLRFSCFVVWFGPRRILCCVIEPYYHGRALQLARLPRRSFRLWSGGCTQRIAQSSRRSRIVIISAPSKSPDLSLFGHLIDHQHSFLWKCLMSTPVSTFSIVLIGLIHIDC